MVVSFFFLVIIHHEYFLGTEKIEGRKKVYIYIYIYIYYELNH